MSVTTDYYAVLGVRRDANADEIKMAFRRLARELHPDVNPDPVARERFKEITQAHEVLSDPDKRQMHDLGGDPFAAAGGYFGQARRERSKEDEYPRGGWEPQRERRPPHRSDSAWNQSSDQATYSAYPGRQPPSFSYDWQRPPAVRAYRPRPLFQAVALTCVVVALAVLVAARVVTHRSHAGLHATPVTTTKTIRVINATWAPPPPGAAAAMTAKQAWLTWSHGEPIRPTVQLGLITQPIGPSHCGPKCDGLPVQNELAYGYHWTSCLPGAKLPATKCWNWLFLDANTGAVITARRYDEPPSPQ
jgi:hypothetical protein